MSHTQKYTCDICGKEMEHPSVILHKIQPHNGNVIYTVLLTPDEELCSECHSKLRKWVSEETKKYQKPSDDSEHIVINCANDGKYSI